MLNVSFIPDYISLYGGEASKARYRVRVNNIIDENSDSYTDVHADCRIYSQDVLNILFDYSLSELNKFFFKLNFDVKVDWWEHNLDISVVCDETTTSPKIVASLKIGNLREWAKPWSLSDLCKEFKINITSLNNTKIKSSVSNDELSVFYYDIDRSLYLKSCLKDLFIILESAVDTTITNLSNTIGKDAILTYFKFPPEIKTACKQYLIYFAQFMEDMGVDIDVNLNDNINYTLFKVTPINKEESLERIQEALAIYLNSANSTNFHSNIFDKENVAVKQWEENINHLQSQLLLASSIIQAKESTIEMLQLSNFQYRTILENNKKTENSEDIIKGIIAVEKYEGKGFSINFAEILRRLKRKITRH